MPSSETTTQNRPSRVFVGLSGGVDSAVSAALLVRAGHEVTGVYMKNWSDIEADTMSPDGQTAGEECGWRVERRDAMRVAAHLDIPFLTYDLEAEYRERVFAYMIREYAAGRTPNPDVLCNDRVKFDAFLERALADGADAVATGHYARIERLPADKYGGSDSALRLLAGVDTDKDQSYFLHRLDARQLAHALFPVGSMRKSEVRALARELGLPNAEKKDSQGLCFVGKVDLRTFLAPHVQQEPGPIVDTDGREIGRHDGMAAFTIGQRHGIGLGGGAPAYVVEKRADTNVLVVARGEDPDALYCSVAVLDDVRWTGDVVPMLPMDCQARIRYRQPLQCVRVEQRGDGKVVLTFAERQRAVSPGQFAVLYDGEVCMGGGVIAE